MSITGPRSQIGKCGLLYTASGNQCFYCDQALEDPAIHWRGATEIYLHPSCCVDFVLRLFRDVHQWQCEGGKNFGETR